MTKEKWEIIDEARRTARSLRELGLVPAAEAVEKLIQLAYDNEGLSMFADWISLEKARQHFLEYVKAANLS